MPAPVPTSTTARAPEAAASSRSAAPAPVPTGVAPELLAAAAGLLDDLALGDELLGVGPAGRLLCTHGRNPIAAASTPPVPLRHAQQTLRLLGNHAQSVILQV